MHTQEAKSVTPAEETIVGFIGDENGNGFSVEGGSELALADTDGIRVNREQQRRIDAEFDLIVQGLGEVTLAVA